MDLIFLHLDNEDTLDGIVYLSKNEKLDGIYNHPSYYAGYFLFNITGNLKCHGSAPAEQNHSSITAHFEESGAWTIKFQSNKLLEK